MKVTINHTDNKFGDILWDGRILRLTQIAYVDNYGTDGDIVYRANAEDADGNDYIVMWEPYPEYAKELPADESDSCDWENPVSIERV
jgi:hypothetical protein